MQMMLDSAGLPEAAKALAPIGVLLEFWKVWTFCSSDERQQTDNWMLPGNKHAYRACAQMSTAASFLTTAIANQLSD